MTGIEENVEVESEPPIKNSQGRGKLFLIAGHSPYSHSELPILITCVCFLRLLLKGWTSVIFYLIVFGMDNQFTDSLNQSTCFVLIP